MVPKILYYTVSSPYLYLAHIIHCIHVLKYVLNNKLVIIPAYNITNNVTEV